MFIQCLSFKNSNFTSLVSLKTEICVGNSEDTIFARKNIQDLTGILKLNELSPFFNL